MAGTAVTLVEALEGLARALEADNKARKLRRVLPVFAFLSFDSRGKAVIPSPIEEGDDLYLQRPQDPGAGNLSKNPAGRRFATALESLAAGKMGEIRTALYEKRWIVDGNPCAVCQANGDAGWIPADEDFPSGDEEPDAHPNCQCDLETRRAEEE